MNLKSNDVTLTEAREMMNHLVLGVNPYTGTSLDEAEYFKHPRILICFTLISEVLTKAIESNKVSCLPASKIPFMISADQAATIVFPPGNLGIKSILLEVNKAIRAANMKSLTIISLYKVLKTQGLLKKTDDAGRTRTTVTDQSKDFGIILVKNTFQGEAYDRIMVTDEGKEYLRIKLPEWYSK